MYDLILCGTGFASSFFLLRFLERYPKSRILVLERGGLIDHWDSVSKRATPGEPIVQTFGKTGWPEKSWLFTLGLGGSSNCWWGQTPRMWPEDFALKSRFGVGFDWPITYLDLESYYERAEVVMGVAGSDISPYPRSGPCPQRPHNLSSLDIALQRLVGPKLWATSPTARSSEGTNFRGKCCANGVCGLCPVDAKFRIMNDLAWLYEDNPAIHIRLGARVTEVIVEAGRATGVRYESEGRSVEVRSDLVFLGMNALFNPAVLLASGDDHPLTGRRLFEQASRKMIVDFASSRDFDGGTHITGLGYMYYGGDERRSRASCMIEHYNAPPVIRTENGKWLSRGVFKIVAENIPEDNNRISLVDGKPSAHFSHHSDYAIRALDSVGTQFVELLSQLDAIENVEVEALSTSEGHIQGTTVMASDASCGVIDGSLQHHHIGNLLVGGSGCFPSGPATNPTLTICALSLRAADRL